VRLAIQSFTSAVTQREERPNFLGRGKPPVATSQKDLLDKIRYVSGIAKSGCKVVAVPIAFLVYRLVSIGRTRRRRAKESADVVKHLRIMGYDPTPYGIGVALVSLQSGYNEVEVASHIAHVTLARDVRESGDDFVKLIGYRSHGMALLKVLKEYKDARAMHPTQWQNDAHAIMGIITVDSEQEAWLAKVLSDPVAGKQRLATSRV
jgi:hypothetical protein